MADEEISAEDALKEIHRLFLENEDFKKCSDWAAAGPGRYVSQAFEWTVEVAVVANTPADSERVRVLYAGYEVLSGQLQGRALFRWAEAKAMSPAQVLEAFRGLTNLASMTVDSAGGNPSIESPG